MGDLKSETFEDVICGWYQRGQNGGAADYNVPPASFTLNGRGGNLRGKGAPSEGNELRNLGGGRGEGGGNRPAELSLLLRKANQGRTERRAEGRTEGNAFAEQIRGRSSRTSIHVACICRLHCETTRGCEILHDGLFCRRIVRDHLREISLKPSRVEE